jgi:hypothetical protein
VQKDENALSTNETFLNPWAVFEAGNYQIAESQLPFAISKTNFTN